MRDWIGDGVCIKCVCVFFCVFFWIFCGYLRIFVACVGWLIFTGYFNEYSFIFPISKPSPKSYLVFGSPKKIAVHEPNASRRCEWVSV